MELLCAPCLYLHLHTRSINACTDMCVHSVAHDVTDAKIHVHDELYGKGEA